MKKIAIIVAILVQFLVLAWMAGEREWIVRTGPTVWLRTAPVDPRDLFRGDYVTLGYEISTIPEEKFGPQLRKEIAAEAEEKGILGTEQEIPVFVALQVDDNGMAEVASVDLIPPGSGLFIKGRVRAYNLSSGALNRVEYGIDAFFVEQGQGRKLEQNPEGTPAGTQVSLEMQAALGRDGTAVLKNYRWAPLGFGVEVRKGRKATEDSAEETPALTLTFHNTSTAPVAIVLPADGQTVRLQGQASWDEPFVDIESASTLPCTDADVRVLQAGETVTVDMKLLPEWQAALAEKELVYFRIVYAPPPVQACASLADAGKIWRGTLESRRLSPHDLWADQ